MTREGSSIFIFRWFEGDQAVEILGAKWISSWTWTQLQTGKRRFGHGFQLSQRPFFHKDPANTQRSCGRTEKGAGAKVQHSCVAEVCQRSAWPWHLDLFLVLTEWSQPSWSHMKHERSAVTSTCSPLSWSYLQQSLRMKLGNTCGNFSDLTRENTWFTKYNKNSMPINLRQDQNLAVVATVKSTIKFNLEATLKTGLMW